MDMKVIKNPKERRCVPRCPTNLNATFSIQMPEKNIIRTGYLFDYSLVSHGESPASSTDMKGAGIYINSEKDGDISIYLSKQELEKLSYAMVSNSKIEINVEGGCHLKTNGYQGYIRYSYLTDKGIKIGVEIVS